MSVNSQQLQIIEDGYNASNKLRKDMVAAMLYNPSVITLRSVAFDLPEFEVKNRLIQELYEDIPRK